MKNKITKIIARVFEVEEEVAVATEYLFDFENWDSLKQMELMKAVEAEFDVHFDQQAIFQFFTVNDIAEALEAMNVQC